MLYISTRLERTYRRHFFRLNMATLCVLWLCLDWIRLADTTKVGLGLAKQALFTHLAPCLRACFRQLLHPTLASLSCRHPPAPHLTTIPRININTPAHLCFWPTPGCQMAGVTLAGIQHVFLIYMTLAYLGVKAKNGALLSCALIITAVVSANLIEFGTPFPEPNVGLASFGGSRCGKGGWDGRD